jgi:hypothetical protein
VSFIEPGVSITRETRREHKTKRSWHGSDPEHSSPESAEGKLADRQKFKLPKHFTFH